MTTPESTGWSTVALRDMGDWRGGGTPSKGDPSFWDGTIPWVSPKDMKRLFIDDSEDHITPVAVESSAAKLIPPNSIAFVVRSGILEHTLPIALITAEATVNQDIRVVTPGPQINPRWLLYRLVADSDNIRRGCRKDGVTVASIEVPQLVAWEVSVPPREEQDRLVGVVERQLALLQEAEAELEAALQRATILRAQVLRHVLQVGQADPDPENGHAGDS